MMEYNRCENNELEPDVLVLNVEYTSEENNNFRTEIWTGKYMQLTVMNIPSCDDIGWEIHMDTDQFIRVEQGKCIAQIGKYKNAKDYERKLYAGEAIFVPAGTWHNIINNGKCSLKLSSIYAPPHHPIGTVHRTKKDEHH